jgi:hypothetical protein
MLLAQASAGIGTSPCSRRLWGFLLGRHASCDCGASTVLIGNGQHTRSVHARPICFAAPPDGNGSIAFRRSIGCATLSRSGTLLEMIHQQSCRITYNGYRPTIQRRETYQILAFFNDIDRNLPDHFGQSRQEADTCQNPRPRQLSLRVGHRVPCGASQIADVGWRLIPTGEHPNRPFPRSYASFDPKSKERRLCCRSMAKFSERSLRYDMRPSPGCETRRFRFNNEN